MSRVWTKRLAGAGFSDWMILDSRRTWFGAGIAVIPSSNGVLTCTVQHTFDPVVPDVPVTVTRLTTVATLLKLNHGMSVGDTVTVTNAGAPLDGTFRVASVVSQDALTYTVPNSGVTSSGAGCLAAFSRVFDHATLAAVTARAEGTYIAPALACRLNVTSYTSGYVDLLVVQQGA